MHLRHDDRQPERGDVALDRRTPQPGGVVVAQAVQQVQHRRSAARPTPVMPICVGVCCGSNTVIDVLRPRTSEKKSQRRWAIGVPCRRKRRQAWTLQARPVRTDQPSHPAGACPQFVGGSFRDPRTAYCHRQAPGWALRVIVEGVGQVGPKFAVRDNAVNVHASKLEEAESAMNAQAAGFLRAIEPLPQEWRGSSFSSWEQLTSAWSAAVKDLNAALGSIKGNVRNAGGLYDAYEAQLTESLSSTGGAADWDGAKFRS